MPSFVSGTQNYPSLQSISNLARSIINDDMPGATDTVGEGSIAVDDQTISTTMLNFMNSSIRELNRDLRNTGDPSLIRDNYLLLSLPPMFGVNGLAVSDPQTQVYIGANGYFNGMMMNSSFLLPTDILLPLALSERQSSSGNVFVPMEHTPDGLPNVSQGQSQRYWEYRGDAIWMPGCLNTVDLKLRYQAVFPDFFGPNLDFSSTYVALQDSQEALAWKIVTKYAMRFGSPLADKADAKAQEAVRAMKLEIVRSQQHVELHRRGYGE